MILPVHMEETHIAIEGEGRCEVPLMGTLVTRFPRPQVLLCSAVVAVGGGGGVALTCFPCCGTSWPPSRSSISGIILGLVYLDASFDSFRPDGRRLSPDQTRPDQAPWLVLPRKLFKAFFYLSVSSVLVQLAFLLCLI